MTTTQLLVAPEVADLLGSDDAVGKVVDAASLGYQCTTCGQPGRLTPDEPASVVVIVHGGHPAASVLRLAHARCSGSGIRTVGDPMRVDLGEIWPGTAWLRPDPDDPAAVLLIGPRVAALRVTAGGEIRDGLSSALLGMGFALMTDLDTRLPDVDGLAVRLGPGGRVAVFDGEDMCLWDGSLTLPAGWAEAAGRAGRVGVVLASGLNLSDPGRDQVADLRAAIGAGAVVGATSEVLYDTDPD